MKKHLLLGCAIVLTSFGLAQSSFEIEEHGNIVNGDTLYVMGNNAAAADYNIEPTIKNISSNTITNVKVKRYEISVQPTSKNYFCWFVCYASMLTGDYPQYPTPALPQWNHALSFVPGQDSILFCHHQPEGTTGTNVYRYVVFDGDNPNDSDFVDVIFEIGAVGIEENNSLTAKHYPNPVSDVMTVQIDKAQNGLSLNVMDMLGKKVESRIFTGTTERIDVADYRNGIYFYTIIGENGVLVTRKFIVGK